jgi:hypothetical protein
MLAFSTNAFAEEITPKYDPLEPGYHYTPSSSNQSKDEMFRERSIVIAGTTTSVTRQVTQTSSTTSNVSVQAEFDAILYKIGISTEVELNKTKSTTVSVTWNLNTPGVYDCVAGKMKETTIGFLQYVGNDGREVSNKQVSSNWTYMGYNEAIRIS